MKLHSTLNYIKGTSFTMQLLSFLIVKQKNKIYLFSRFVFAIWNLTLGKHFLFTQAIKAICDKATVTRIIIANELNVQTVYHPVPYNSTSSVLNETSSFVELLVSFDDIVHECIIVNLPDILVRLHRFCFSSETTGQSQMGFNLESWLVTASNPTSTKHSI